MHIRICDVYVEVYFTQNKIITKVKTWDWVEKKISGVETRRLSGKENVLGATVSLEGLLEHERAHDYEFPWIWYHRKQFLLSIP